MIGVAFNIWDGDEHLPESLAAVKKYADYVVAVYQTVSNFGELYEPVIPEGFDLIVKYEPNLNQTPHWNELAKRNLAMGLCRLKGCTFFQTVDCDEIYDANQILYVRDRMVNEGFDASACQMQTFYGDTKHCFVEPETYYVPLLYKCDERHFREYVQWAVLADPTRKLPSNKVLVLNRDECEMLHYSYVRNDIGRKLRNSSARRNLQATMQQVIDYYNVWKPPMPGLIGGNLVPLRLFNS